MCAVPPPLCGHRPRLAVICPPARQPASLPARATPPPPPPSLAEARRGVVAFSRLTAADGPRSLQGPGGASAGGGDLPRGSVGFLVTGLVLKEKHAGLEVIQVLKDLYEAAGVRAAPHATEKEAPGAGGAAGALEAELGAMRNPDSWVFTLHSVGVRGAIFVKMKIPEKDAAWAPRPSQLAQEMMERTRETGVSLCRFASRVLPVEYSCFCNIDDMKALAAKVIPTAFAEEERVTFSVQYEHRAAQKLDRGEIIDAFAKAVPERHIVDLNSPQRTILVQLVKGTCAVSVVEGFKKHCKYNLKTLTGVDEQGKPLKPKSGDGKDGEEVGKAKTQAGEIKDATAVAQQPEGALESPAAAKENLEAQAGREEEGAGGRGETEAVGNE